MAATRLGGRVSMQVCPVCVRAPARLIRRETALELTHGCTLHGIWLRRQCVCGERIEPFTRERPFGCAACGRDWADLPRQPLGPRDELRQRRVAHAYDIVLRRSSARVVEVARRVLARDEGGRWDHGWCLADDGALANRSMEARYVKSVSAIVANLVLREVPPERLLDEAEVGPHPDLACRNAACETFGTSARIAVSAMRTAGVESYCAECGSRFLGERTVLSFDLGNGSPDLGGPAVLRAQARLAGYAMRLAEAAAFFAHTDRSVEADHVFHLAGVPVASYLRARRLGLVALVARRLGRPIRRYGRWDRDRVDLVEDAFADRWSFQAARPDPGALMIVARRERRRPA